MIVSELIEILQNCNCNARVLVDAESGLEDDPKDIDHISPEEQFQNNAETVWINLT